MLVSSQGGVGRIRMQEDEDAAATAAAPIRELETQLSGSTHDMIVEMELGCPTEESVHHSINCAFKLLVAVALETDYKFSRAMPFVEYLDAVVSGEMYPFILCVWSPPARHSWVVLWWA